MTSIPGFVIEYFLLGRTSPDALERYTQDGGVVTDVWHAFATDRSGPVRVLMAPTQGTSAVAMGRALHQSIREYRTREDCLERESAAVSPLEGFAAASIYFDELIRVVLPLTTWWHEKHLAAIGKKAADYPENLEHKLWEAIVSQLRGIREIELRRTLLRPEESLIDRRVIEAAPLAALIGVFALADNPNNGFAQLSQLDMKAPGFEAQFKNWVFANAESIAEAARAELSRQFEFTAARTFRSPHVETSQRSTDGTESAPAMVMRVFLNRQAGLADTEGNCTVKADAAMRVFDLRCRGITWAIIDSGIATTHPAFLDYEARDRRGRPIEPTPSRIRATLDFTCIDRIRNFDLTEHPEGDPGRDQAIERVVDELAELPERSNKPDFREMAFEKLRAIARQLDQGIPPDWNLIEPLILIDNTDDGSSLVSDHGTHVAGILAADWRLPGDKKPYLQGVCPDLDLYDLRVVDRESRKSTEFALLASLEYVQFVNTRSGSNGQVIHGVNVSMSIPHDVRNYGCGSTPVCVACDRLVGAGVVVVAAAGNRGWNEAEHGFGNFVYCSITDPGNARLVLTVGSTHRLKPHTYGVSYFSSRGPTGDGRLKPDLVAPGEKIRGPIRGEADTELDGTSMAAPFVSGAAAMLLARHRELIGDPARVKKILCESATDLERERYFQGHGLLDVLRALQSL